MECDVLVIGSGASGSALSWYLSENTNLKIICVEQGSWTSPNEYPSNFIDWEKRKRGEFSFDPKNRSDFRNFTYHDDDSPIKLSFFSGVGGSTVLFSGHYPRFHPSDFKVKTLDGVASDWPISYQDLEKYYNLNDLNIGVAGLEGDPAYPRIQNLLPPVPIGKMGVKIGNAFNKLGWHWWPSYSAINTSKRFQGSPCVNLGPCNTGCAQGAKSSSDIRYWPKSISNGVELITKTRATRINIDDKDKITSVSVVDSLGKAEQIHAKIYVLACNALWTPHLLLNSTSSRFPAGLANRSGLVGKNLMLHPLAYLEGIVDEEIDSSVGPQGCCIISQEFFETNKSNEFLRGFTMQVLRSPGPLETMERAISRSNASFGATFHNDFERIFNKTISLSMIIEDLPDEDNQVFLSDKLDSFGSYVPQIHYKLGENTKRIASHALKSGVRLMKEVGATDIIKYAPISNAGWHLMGTARMGDNPASSVTNKFGQCHDVSNLFVADSSLFPTSSSVNPASTIQALALFIANHIALNFESLTTK